MKSPADKPPARTNTGMWLAAVLLLGIALALTNPCFTVIEDEVQAFAPANGTATDLLRSYWRAEGPHHRPPLFDLIHLGWLHLTHGNLRLMRLPSILFFLSGLWLLAKAACRSAGPAGMRNVFLLGLLWPYGFHYVRLAVGYSWYFLLVALLTYAYLRFREQPTISRWALLTAAALALVYSNYLGWPMLACLAFGFWLERRQDFLKHWRSVLGTFLLLFVACLPQWHSVIKEMRSGPEWSHSLASNALYAGYAGYTLFVSESVAPWFWWFSVPAMLAIAVALGVVLVRGPRQARLFLLYFFLGLGVMAVLGILTVKRTMLIAPWLLLPLGITLAALESKFIRRSLVISLTLTFGIGWFGIASRQYYAAPRFFEPWAEVGREIAQSVGRGAMVIGNHPSFFFYLASELQNAAATSASHSPALHTYSNCDPAIYDPDEWVVAGRPLRPTVMLVQGVPFLPEKGTMEVAQNWLNDRCQLTGSSRKAADPGYVWKDRYRPGLGQSAWRIQTRTYSCPVSETAKSAR